VGCSGPSLTGQRRRVVHAILALQRDESCFVVVCELLKRDGSCAAQGVYVQEYWKHSRVAVPASQSPLVIVPSSEWP
jgi:hypothetical protein